MNDIEPSEIEQLRQRLERIEQLHVRRGGADEPKRRGWALRSVGWLAAGGLLSAPVLAWGALDLQVFEPGTTILAGEVNANFEKIALAAQQATPIGAVIPFAGDGSDTMESQSGFLPCDGREVSREQYSTLFAVIGVAHGDGNGSSTFNVPDYRGYFLRGVSGPSGRDPDSEIREPPGPNGSGNAGAKVGSVQGDAFAGHAHGTAVSHPDDNPDFNAFDTGSYGIAPHVIVGVAAGTHNAQNSSRTGGAENRPANAYVHFLIRAE
jgi:hypothetical protein